MKTMGNMGSVRFPHSYWNCHTPWSLTTVLVHIVKTQLEGISWTSLDSDS